MLALVFVPGFLLPGAAGKAAERPELLIQLLDQGRCAGCQLTDADLVLAHLPNADLRGAKLNGANLSQAQLDGAKLNGADLRNTSLLGASLRGADLRGANLEGTDLRQADLSGALLDRTALERAHWQQAKGINSNQLSYAQLHNAGVAAHDAGQPQKAELWFSQAIQRQPEAAVSWVARAISRSQQGKTPLAANDFDTAARLYAQRGDGESAKQLKEAATALAKPQKQEPGGNGIGSQLLGTAAALAKLLGPLAGLALLPIGI
ncbi:pentapeptide repeat-containing protein [Cyanobium sp. WAJ14-Wanaka]|nr:pentapeptide repeat-containing protein [Cyanobium sp. WAJ14-Wanaka]